MNHALAREIAELPVGALFRVYITGREDYSTVVYERLVNNCMQCVLNSHSTRGSVGSLGEMPIADNVPSHWGWITRLGDKQTAAHHMLIAHGLFDRATELLRRGV